MNFDKKKVKKIFVKGSSGDKFFFYFSILMDASCNMIISEYSAKTVPCASQLNR